MKDKRLLMLWLLVASCCIFRGAIATGVPIEKCSVVIVGGSTAAVAAAISSAQNGVSTCLLEPTDWPGGQITAEGVPEIDFAWQVLKDPKTNQTLNVPVIDRDPANVTPSFRQLLQKIGNPGWCFVSTNCFPPKEFLEGGLFPLLQSLSRSLRIFYNTVIKSAETTAGEGGDVSITSVTAITRYPASSLACGGWDVFLSEDVEDWYSIDDSPRFKKVVTEFRGSVFIDASDWGELLALSDAPYLQGIEERYDGDISGEGNSTCGQAPTFSFTQVYHHQPVTNQSKEDPYPHPPEFEAWFNYSYTYFNKRLGLNWDLVWESRRMLSPVGHYGPPSPGDISLLNYYCSDNVFSYPLLSRKDTTQQAHSGDWKGGVDVNNLRTAEWIAIAWHYWYRNQSSEAVRPYLALGRGPLGTCHGLSKVPYLRDTRRSIGMGGFLLNLTSITGPINNTVGEVFPDRMALGAYNVDFHRMQIDSCKYPSYMSKEAVDTYMVLPYYIPYRALTNMGVSNLLVAGKTMAQSFLANAATRLHPVEWSSGTAAGVVAAYMASRGIYSTSDLYNDAVALGNVLELSSKFTPNRWFINGTYWPPS